MIDFWTQRDYPVLLAVVRLFMHTGDTSIPVSHVQRLSQLPKPDVQLALQALYSQPYLREDGKQVNAAGEFQYVGAPNGEALRLAGAWPTPENLLERLVAALESAGEDDSREPEERHKLKQAALWLRGAFSQVALGALGGAGGNIISGG
ncbi:hypothetical protein [Mycolicibacterium obuense]|uniref:Uncharacterized protein n=1 Tax=Mycolicibacterium obuense TaxID=1807 RepID=A0A0J6VLE2_9MYCO|nr:hypothetical protein [Mycolicibacterium obuense]KMO71835.1 hypothetical protein MOBUDSM44075_04187 [Mycolicibacterium obuense]